MASASSSPSTFTGRASRTTRRSTAAVSPSGAGSSPTRITRIQEKEELRQLNDRLAAYIEQVRQLENEKSSMQILLEEKEESRGREVGSMRLLYETELADARKILDTTANERARLQIELSQLSEDHARLQARYRSSIRHRLSVHLPDRGFLIVMNQRPSNCVCRPISFSIMHVFNV